MGYESKLYIVQKSTQKGMKLEEAENFIWAAKIAEFNLCKMDYNGPFHIALNNMRKTDCFIYSDDGETPITKDRYGEYLQEINIRPLIKILEKENQEYRRIKPVINFLKSLNNENWPNLMILHYGY